MENSETPALVKPLIHMNGTGKNALGREYLNARKAIRDAQKALQELTVHARDYYTHKDPQAFEKAREQHRDRLRKLEEINVELGEIMVHIMDS